MRIDPKPTFPAKVGLTVPGQAAPAELDLVFRHKDKAALQAWMTGRPAGGEAGAAAAPLARTDAEFLGEVVAGWSGVQDAAGADVPYTPEAFARLLQNYPAAAGEIYRAYLRELTESRLKN